MAKTEKKNIRLAKVSRKKDLKNEAMTNKK